MIAICSAPACRRFGSVTTRTCRTQGGGKPPHSKHASTSHALSEYFISALPRQLPSTSEPRMSLASGETNSCRGAHVLQGRHNVGSSARSANVPAAPTQMRRLPGVSKNNEVVEYAYRRSASPALIAEYLACLASSRVRTRDIEPPRRSRAWNKGTADGRMGRYANPRAANRRAKRHRRGHCGGLRAD